MRHLYAEDYLQISVGQLQPLVPGDRRDGVVIAERPFQAAEVDQQPFRAAVAYELRLDAPVPHVVLTHEQSTTAVALVWIDNRARYRRDPDGTYTRNADDERVECVPAYRSWFFMGSDGKRAIKLYYVPGHGFVTRTSLNLVPKIRYLGCRAKLKHRRARTAAKLRKLYRQHPYLERIAELEGKLEDLSRQLAR